jgi:hypothetical protein
MPGLISGSTLRRGGSGQFINLANAQPQLPPTPSTSTGFTLITSDTLVTTYASSLGNIQFSSSTAYSNVPGQSLTLIGTGTTSVIVAGGTATTSTNTGALVVNGGVGIRDDLFVGGNATLQRLTLNEFTATTATIFKLNVIGSETSISTTTGAVVVNGGVGIGKDLYVGNNINSYRINSVLGNIVNLAVTGTNISNDVSSGALVVAGGVGIAGNTIIGTTLSVGSTATFSTDVNVTRDVTIDGKLTVQGTGDVDLSPEAANVTITPSLGGSVTIRPSVQGSIDNIEIGASNPKNAYFQNSYANNFIGLSTTATNLERGQLGSIPYQIEPGVTGFIDIGEINTVLVSNGSTATWSNAANLSVSTSTFADTVFINVAVTNTDYRVILSTGTNEYAPLEQDVGLSYNTTTGTLTTPNLVAIESVYSREGIVDESNLLYTPRVTISTTAPLDPRIGDFWIDPTYGVELQYVNDNGNKFWVQFTGL